MVGVTYGAVEGKVEVCATHDILGEMCLRRGIIEKLMYAVGST